MIKISVYESVRTWAKVRFESDKKTKFERFEEIDSFVKEIISENSPYEAFMASPLFVIETDQEAPALIITVSILPNSESPVKLNKSLDDLEKRNDVALIENNL